MDRRQFTKTIVVAGLAAPAMLRGSPGYANLRESRDKILRRLIYQNKGIEQRVERLTLLNPSGALSLSLRARMTAFNEDRTEIDLAGIGDYLRPTLQDRVDTSDKVGNIYLDGGHLFVQPLNTEIGGVTKVILAHRNMSYEPRGRPKPARLNKIPILGSLFKAGEARRNRNHLLIFLTPAIIRDSN